MEYFFYKNVNNTDSPISLSEGLKVVRCFPYRKVKGMDRFCFSIKKSLSLAIQTIVWGYKFEVL